MGNNSTKEARGPDSPSANPQRRPGSAGGPSGPTSPTGRHHSHSNPYASRSGRGSRPDLSFLGLGGSSNNDVPERRETKQEREARKLEKERVARIKERERSLKEEHIDGGFLVTMGVYTGPEDFSKPTVRHLMIERRIAPFWRGLDDFREDWTEHQLVAAGRGLPIPAVDEVPPELTRTLSTEPPSTSDNNIQNLMVPITARSQSAASDTSTTLSPSHPAFAGTSPTSPIASSPPSSSPFRPRSKTLASLTTSSKTPSQTEMTPREINLPKDPFVNGQQIEVFLYKDAAECPICFLYYPPYLNKTRCCDQAICSECFVQIKRPDPHPPEHEQSDATHQASGPETAESAAEPESLVSEPAQCPYCQQTNFGVTYEPPPFRRGLAYANPTQGLSALASAMSSSSSLASTGAPTQALNTHKRRTTSISADAANVITTDRIRPDWATKLANARSHLARRSAAATALHTAAYLMGNANSESRGFGFSTRRTFGRHRGGDSPASGSATPSQLAPDNSGQGTTEQSSRTGGSSRRRSRMDDLEDMMMMEAIRLSLAAEEERKRKAEKEAAKEAKRRAKEEKKREKKEKKVYGSGPSSASGSTLSLSLGLGRRRGNSGASNLAKEITPESVEPADPKGKGIDRGNGSVSTSAPMDCRLGEGSGSGSRHLDTNSSAFLGDLHQSLPSPTAPEKPSHLRQMSNASSPASSFVDSPAGSLRNGLQGHGSSSTLDSPNASGTNVAGRSSPTPDGGDEDGGAGSEPMFNFPSLAAMISIEEGSEDSKDGVNHIEHAEPEPSSSSKTEDSMSSTGLESSIATLKVDSYGHQINGGPRQATLLESQESTPEVTITPETPAALHHGEQEGKQLGWSQEVGAQEITQ